MPTVKVAGKTKKFPYTVKGKASAKKFAKKPKGKMIDKKKLPIAGKPTKLGGGGRFAMVEAKAKASGAKNPGAAAAAGMKKYGKKKMLKMAKKGKK